MTSPPAHLHRYRTIPSFSHPPSLSVSATFPYFLGEPCGLFITSSLACVFARSLSFLPSLFFSARPIPLRLFSQRSSLSTRDPRSGRPPPPAVTGSPFFIYDHPLGSVRVLFRPGFSPFRLVFEYYPQIPDPGMASGLENPSFLLCPPDFPRFPAMASIYFSFFLCSFFSLSAVSDRQSVSATSARTLLVFSSPPVYSLLLFSKIFTFSDGRWSSSVSTLSSFWDIIISFLVSTRVLGSPGGVDSSYSFVVELLPFADISAASHFGLFPQCPYRDPPDFQARIFFLSTERVPIMGRIFFFPVALVVLRKRPRMMVDFFQR